MSHGTVEGIFVAAEQSGPVSPVDEVPVDPKGGLAGDRKDGDITLIEAEAIEGLAEDTGIELGPGESRRQVLTRGIQLNDLVGRRFAVGEIECVGVELCHPCRHLERLTRPGVLEGLVDRGGLRADIVSGGTLRVGDAVRALDGP
jgi:MOSC domain-containing protein YiiM